MAVRFSFNLLMLSSMFSVLVAMANIEQLPPYNSNRHQAQSSANYATSGAVVALKKFQGVWQTGW